MFGCWVSQPFGLWQLRKREKYCRYSANKPAKKSPSQPTAPRTGTTPVHRRRAGRKLCRLTRDPAERPLAYDLRRLRAAAPQHHRRAATPPERGTACTLRRSCGHCSTAAGPRPRRTVDSTAPSARPRLSQSTEMVAPSAFPPSAGSTDCDDTRPSSAPPVPSAGRAARPAERRNAGTPPVRATPPRQRRPLSGNLRRLPTCTFLLFRSGLFCTHRYLFFVCFILRAPDSAGDRYARVLGARTLLL